MNKEHVQYLDNIRILLIGFVIFTHISMIYGAPSSWYYTEVRRPDNFTSGVFTVIMLWGRACGLATFFGLAGYFTTIKLVEYRQQGQNYLISRLKRLGYPLAFYLLVIAPLTKSMAGAIVYGQKFNLLTIYSNYFRYFTGAQAGPMWFLELLIIFTLIYVFWFTVIRKGKPLKLSERFKSFPATRTLLIFIVAMSAVTFVVRLRFDEGYYWPPMNLELAHVPQYIVFFIFGILLPQTNWQLKIPNKVGRIWFVVAVTNVAVVLPVVFAFVVTTGRDVRDFTGGANLSALLLVVWEIISLVAYNIAYFHYFKKYVYKSGPVTNFIVQNLYVTYVVHPIVVVVIALLIRNIHLYPLLKVALFGPVMFFASFFVAHLIRKIPGVKAVLQEKG